MFRYKILESFTQSSWEEQDRIEKTLLSLLKKAKKFLSQYKKTRIHSSKNPKVVLDNKIYQQGIGPKPDGFWYSFGASWINALEEYPEWISPYFYTVEGVNPFSIDKNIQDFDLYNSGDDEWAWNEIQKDYKEYNGIEVLSNKIVQNLLPNWWAPSGCLWNTNGVSIKMLDSPFTEEEVSFINKNTRKIQ